MRKELLEQVIANASAHELRAAIRELMSVHATPVFGAARTVEHEVAALRALRILKFLPSDVDEYGLVESLRVTKQKARGLLYQEALRTEVADPEAELRDLLTSPRIHRDPGSKFFLVDVPSPLTLDRLRSRVRGMGFLTDGSFSAGVARLPEAALVALVADLIPPESQNAIRKMMVKRGVTNASFGGVVMAALKQVAGKAVGAAGEEVVGAAASSVCDAIGRVFEARVDVSWLNSVGDQ